MSRGKSKFLPEPGSQFQVSIFKTILSPDMELLDEPNKSCLSLEGKVGLGGNKSAPILQS